MKKEMIALALLIALFGLSLANIAYLSGMIDSIDAEISESAHLADTGDWDRAEYELGQAQELWEDAKHYMDVFVRHSETNAAQDVLYELLGDIKARDAAAAEATVARLLAQLSDIREMEQIRLGSAF